jgi:hypothetical protein
MSKRTIWESSNTSLMILWRNNRLQSQSEVNGNRLNTHYYGLYKK